jgi:hypothetical protein
MTRVLIIGGAHDGSWREVDTCYEHVQLLSPVPTQEQPIDYPGDILSESSVTFVEDSYTRTPFQGDSGHRFFVYRQRDLSVDDVVDHLIRFYRP